MNPTSLPHAPPAALSPLRRMAEQAFSRAAGTPLCGGNRVDLLIDAQAHFDAWLDAIAAAQQSIFLENYIIRDDMVGQRFRDALIERVAAGVSAHVLYDWMGCLGQAGRSYWKSLTDAGVEVRSWNPPRFDSPMGWVSRDHRKLLVVDGRIGFISGVCLSGKWLGDATKNIPPWRDTGVAVRGPAVADLANAFAENWAMLGSALPGTLLGIVPADAGDVDLRVVSTIPSIAGLYRMDQLIAAMARKRLWLADAYFVGIPPYVQGLTAAARDGVDVRLLVPGASDIPAVARLSRAGYRPLLQAGVRLFEWNGSMMHAKTAVCDSRWARVGSSNLNIASWLGNCEIDVAVENADFARAMEEQFDRDLENATEIVLTRRRVHRSANGKPRLRHGTGSSSRAAAGVLRLAHSFGAALSNQRVLGDEVASMPWTSFALLALAMLAVYWPALVAWPIALLLGLLGFSLFARFLRARHDAGKQTNPQSQEISSAPDAARVDQAPDAVPTAPRPQNRN